MPETFSILYASTIAGLATGLGGIIVFLFRPRSERIMSFSLGLAGGIMLAVITFELIPYALKLTNLLYTALGFCLGIMILFLLDTIIPHIHIETGEKERGRLIKMGILIALGIGLHNMPEGLAIGAGYKAAAALGFTVALAIGLHNIPEGIAIAVPLQVGGTSNHRMIFATVLAGLCTPLGMAIGFLFYHISRAVIGTCLALAGGAMLYIVSDELIPESHKHHSHYANLGITVGFIFILFLSGLHL